MSDNPFVGNWTYRSFLNDPDINKSFNDLEFGVGTIVIEEAPMQTLKGTIGGSGWSLVLKGARQYGNPMHARFQGVGIVNGEKWVYDYDGYLVPRLAERCGPDSGDCWLCGTNDPAFRQPARHDLSGRGCMLVLCRVCGTSLGWPGSAGRWLVSMS